MRNLNAAADITSNKVSKPKKINSEINFLKFCFAVFILLRHFLGEYSKVYSDRMFKLWDSHGAYFGVFGVAFFFIVSGYYMTASGMKNTDISAPAERSFNYALDKFKRLFLPLAISMVLTFSVKCAELYAASETTGEWIKGVKAMLFSVFIETTALEYTGLPCSLINGPTWYVSAMLIAMLPLYMILIKNKDFFLYFLAPFGGLMLLGYSYRFSDGNLAKRGLYFRLGRAFWGLLLGGICYLIAKKLENCRPKTRKLLTVLEVLLWTGTAFYLFFEDESFTNEGNAVLILLLVIVLSIVFSQQTYLSELFSKLEKPCNFLGSMSVYIFFNHWGILEFISHFSPSGSVKIQFLIFLGAVLLFSVAEYYIISFIKKKKKENKKT